MKVKGESTPKSFKLGSYPEHDINEIRFRFNEYKKLCLDGINPRDVFERQKQEEQRVKSLIKQRNMTLQAVFDDYLETNIHLQTKTIRDMQNSLNFNCKNLLKKPISDITVTELEWFYFKYTPSGKGNVSTGLSTYCRETNVKNWNQVSEIIKCTSNNTFNKINGNSCISDKTYKFPFSLVNPYYSNTK